MTINIKHIEPSLRDGSTVIITAIEQNYLLVCVNVRDGFAHGGDLLGIFVRDLSAELVFKSHDQLNEIERISFKVLTETSFRCDLRLIRAEQIFDNRLRLQYMCQT